MLKRWVSKNVDLLLLAERVKAFFETKGYGTLAKELKNGFSISLSTFDSRNTRGRLAVTVIGNPNDFSVEFVGVDNSWSSTLLGYTTLLFGGGILLRKSLEFREALDRLESEFWGCMEDVVTKLSGSAIESGFKKTSLSK